MSILEEVFHPGARHREEQRHRLEWMRDGEGDPYRGPIDLDSGTVHIRIGSKAPTRRSDSGVDVRRAVTVPVPAS